MTAPAKKGSRALAAVLVALGVVLFFTAGSVVGAIVGGLGVAIFGWLMTRPSGTALVGKRCAHCGDGIFVEARADRCATCSEPLHARCLDTHTAAKHVAPGG